MKMPSLLKRKKLSASTARRPRSFGLPDGMDYEQMSEPNMKLSRALLIVLVLHIVAVAGIIAFNTIKTREAGSASAAESIATASPATLAEPTAATPNEVAQVGVPVKTRTMEKTAEHAKPPPKTSGVADSGKIYVVVKGDNPVTIARHLKISEADLLELNAITDPRKLQIGQKLRIPEHTTPSKSKAD
jgi:LysM repeat protein